MVRYLLQIQTLIMRLRLKRDAMAEESKWSTRKARRKMGAPKGFAYCMLVASEKA